MARVCLPPQPTLSAPPGAQARTAPIAMSLQEPWQRLAIFSEADSLVSGLATYPLLLRQTTAVWTNNSLIIFGGNNLDVQQQSTAWSYNLGLREWTLLEPSGAAQPTGRSAHGAAWTGRRMLAFGGSCGATCILSDLWSLQLLTPPPPPPLQPPSPLSPQPSPPPPTAPPPPSDLPPHAPPGSPPPTNPSPMPPPPPTSPPPPSSPPPLPPADPLPRSPPTPGSPPPPPTSPPPPMGFAGGEAPLRHAQAAWASFEHPLGAVSPGGRYGHRLANLIPNPNPNPRPHPHPHPHPHPRPHPHPHPHPHPSPDPNPDPDPVPLTLSSVAWAADYGVLLVFGGWMAGSRKLSSALWVTLGLGLGVGVGVGIGLG